MNHPVLITGMHRSGTSLTAQVLHRLGLSLGPEDRLLPPEPNNPDGFFENRDVVTLNDRLLERARGAWDLVPPPPRERVLQRWRDLADGARALCTELAEHAGPQRRWGFKDPRACLTLPFWSELLPEASLVVCIRDPVSVARSLRHRNHGSIRFGLKLCQDYLLRLQANLSAARHPLLVISMELLTTDPAVQIERLVRFVGLSTNPDEARSIVKRDLIHHQCDIDEDKRWCRDYPALIEAYRLLLAKASD